MKIAIVVRGINQGGGIERYLKNLIWEVDKLIVKEEQLSLVLAVDENYDFLKGLKNIEIDKISVSQKLIWDNWSLFWWIKKSNPDAIIYPKNVIPVSNFWFKSIKKINIIHDLAHFQTDFNAYKFKDVLFMKTFMEVSCKRADKTIAISENTKKDIIEKFGVKKEKVEVIYEAVEGGFKKVTNKKIIHSVMNRYGIEPPFVFYSGSISPRKNVLRMLKAFNGIKDKIPHNFYFTGARGWNNQDIWQYIKFANLENRVKKLGFVADEDLPVVYSLADVCLYPSLYEGFGLPILEAQGCGCPVLTSDGSCLPEIAGEGAHIVDPYSVNEIEAGILKIVEDSKYREKLVERGFKNIQRFSWEKTAKQVLNLVTES